MSVYLAFPYASALAALSVAVFAWFYTKRSLAYRILAMGMLFLALDQVFLGLSLQTLAPSRVLFWNWLDSLVEALIPGTWLLFSLTFARINHRQFVSRWKWVVGACYGIPLILVTCFTGAFDVGIATVDQFPHWVIGLGWAGYAYQVFWVVAAVLILLNLEKTLRAFTGSMHWQIKFVILGLCGLFAVHIYISSQALLYASIKLSLEPLTSGALIVAALLTMLSLFRARFAQIDIYLSQTFLVNSLTLLIVGAYLLATGFIALGMSYLAVDSDFPFEMFFTFLAALALGLILMSGQMRQKLRRFVNRHFQRPQYDYRSEWATFTQKTLSLVDSNRLCTAAAKALSETFGTPGVTIWLLNQAEDCLAVAGSTVLSMAEVKVFHLNEQGLRGLLHSIPHEAFPFNIHTPQGSALKNIRNGEERLVDDRSHYCAPLVAAGEPLGFIILSDRLDGRPLSTEDYELLKTIADQTAGSLLNAQLSEQLRIAKQMEAFQHISAFFAHDLKNLAATLSLTVQNLPLHFDNPEFREDALRGLSQTVDKMNRMCSRLSAFKHEIESQKTRIDLNEVVVQTLASLNGSDNSIFKKDLAPLPEITVDPEQIQKVLVNFLLNAKDAVEGKGEIRIATARRDESVVLSVSDNGCGIPEDFLQHSLFAPFKTTKKKGLGIGLFHCKKIVEAHGGRIRVESKVGEGTRFEVILPIS